MPTADASPARASSTSPPLQHPPQEPAALPDGQDMALNGGGGGQVPPPPPARMLLAPPDPSPIPARPPSSARHASTQVIYDDPDFSRPPPLNYTLRTRVRAISAFWTLLVLDVVCVPIALYFGLWYGTDLSPNAVFSISTGTLGTVSLVEYWVRFRRLWRRGSTCRVIGASRWYLDWFHWNLSLGWMAVMVELIVGTIPRDPPVRLLAMPVSSMCFAIGIQMLAVDGLRLLGLTLPVRVSSLPAGAPLRPAIYSFVEDVVAVDGSGGTEFRQRLNLRYRASHMFRLMLHRLTLFWALGAIGAAAATTALVFTLERDAAYVVGWMLPFVWAAAWAAITVRWMQVGLRREYQTWSRERYRKPSEA